MHTCTYMSLVPRSSYISEESGYIQVGFFSQSVFGEVRWQPLTPNKVCTD